MKKRELFSLWDKRDQRYRERKFHGAYQALSPQEVVSIQAYRMVECDLLDDLDDRIDAASHARSWEPPFVGLR